MAGPPKSKPKGPDDLAEVERALSVLQGRHPEHERVRREDEANRSRRAAEIDAVASAAARKSRTRQLGIVAVAVPVLALAVFVAFLFRRESARLEHLESLTSPFRALGFAVVEISSPGKPHTLGVTVQPGCYVAVASGSATLDVVLDESNTGSAQGPLLFCTCEAGPLTVRAPVEQSGGIVLLRTDASNVGGTSAFPFLAFEPGLILEADAACADASLDAWIASGRSPRPAPDPSWLTSFPRDELKRVGFSVIATAPPETPFVVVDVPKEACLLATSAVGSDRLSLRATGGALTVPETKGTFVRCAEAEGKFVVAREGDGRLDVLVAPARRVGGAHSLYAIARAGGLIPGRVVVAESDRPWDARQVLLASQVPDADISVAKTPDVAAEPTARVVALSFETAGALTAEVPDGVFSYCEPTLDAATRDAVCVFSGAQKWRANGSGAVGALARAKLPFWLYVMQVVNDPHGLKAMTQLFKLARTLSRDGFVPTTLEALTELPNGAEILGRTGEDAVVAVGVAPMPPFAFPLSENGAPWSLDGAPAIARVAPLQKIKLTTTQRSLPPIDKRRTVVFRRQAPK